VRSLLLAFKRSALEHQGDILETTIDQGETKPLSDREFQVLQLIAAGRSTPEIARELVVSLNTVKTHLKNIYGKLNAHSAKEAAARARDLKLL
jgi:LuxR family maltose regulon positive regulatory protein